jgi:hypothetical protein
VTPIQTAPTDLPQFAPATWRAAALAPWVCWLNLRGEGPVSSEAAHDLSERLRDSNDPVLQALCSNDSASPDDHINAATKQPVLVHAAGQALTTIVQSGPLGTAAERELLAILDAQLAAHPSPGRSSQPLPSSVRVLLMPQVAPKPYAEPSDRRALGFQVLGVVLFLALFGGMAFLLQM